LNEAANIVTQHLTKSLIDLRGFRLASQGDNPLAQKVSSDRELLGKALPFGLAFRNVRAQEKVKEA
jgi:hypothetical protein